MLAFGGNGALQRHQGAKTESARVANDFRLCRRAWSPTGRRAAA